ncbi:MAG: response regulator transcription factor [Faecalibacterium sp.]|nr:response regulator transcription factor [Ruminococcus sp.]MCM1391847.1 response regulator transcription factor [Ruminococcus sp.]MCM1485711.1 response regulator transcription factor [Faecalibacterium sp.]
MIKILLVEDDMNIVTALSEILSKESIAVDYATGQTAALEKIANTSYDLLLLDIFLADGNGFAVCSAIKAKSDTPVIFLTASGDEYSVVTGLDMGADDYIEKPYRPRELISRIKSVLRRYGKTQSIASFGNVTVDMDKGIVTKNGKDVFLSALEYRLFLVFLNNPGVVLSRANLLAEIWDVAGDFVNDNTLTVYIKRLRDKIEDDAQNPSIIRTVRGLGYMLGE